MKYDISSLTLEEKLRLLCGKDRWNMDTANGKLRATLMQDGPSGVRKITDDSREPATAMPTLSVVANTWNLELAKLDGATIGDECAEKEVDIILAPGVNIKRTPLCGRNFEYFSEDPYLSGVMGREFICGCQEKGVGTSLKHYCLNNREFDRFFQSNEVDERTLREIYLRPFEIALQAEPYTVMCSYNPVNGIHASQNKWILKDILRKEFGYDGVIVSDWGAVHSSYKAVKATLDLEMPYASESYENLKNAYDKGFLSDDEIDFCVTNLLKLIEKCDNEKKCVFTKTQRHENAIKIAEEGIVLLKNNGALPIKNGKYFVCGDEARHPTIGGSGSSAVLTDYKQRPLHELLNEVSDGAEFEATTVNIQGNRAWNMRGLYAKAYSYDGVILAVSADEQGESGDRDSMRLSPYIEDVINETAKHNKNVIVLVYSGSAVDMSAWVDNVNAVMFVGYAGEGVNEALTNLLTGGAVPSGKLAETFPRTLDDTFEKTGHGNGCVNLYTDGVLVGYRYYDTKNIDVLFPFGHGLSYADFSYSNLRVKKLGDIDYEVLYDITNNSAFDAKEVSQLYIKHVFPMVLRPEKELRSFSKDLIKAGETKTICLKLDKSAFAYYSIPLKDWYVENGMYEIMVGSSSSDIRLMAKLFIDLPDETQATYPIFEYSEDKS